eukprot:CAMPEP_0171095684 /NCGR_PEP_ID=MMETSP0766_2-20121228/43313_1 /TAXON_ID=439317 /ORGANISM="Gambierdiscus australes, Strain CAWD 149" /LENGTH=303 /DNA_ID=CAMNT_0011554529 /DNA_START=6 /DNA_END=917 /DNA_ORIENTATION=-
MAADVPQPGMQPPNVRNLLAGSIVGSAVANAQAEGVAPSADSEPLHQSRSSQVTRNQFHETQRHVAAQMLAYSLPVLACVFLLILALAIAGVTIYIKGWLVWSSDREKKCDQPLKWWLLTMLLLPVLQIQANSHEGSRTSRFQVLVMPILIAIGTWLCVGCRTCQTTNPNLYQFVKMYLIYQTSVWVLMMFILFGLVTLIFWLHRHGLLDNGPGPAMAAKPGLINDIETVPYSASLCSGEENGGESPECCICQDVFSAQDVIKRTPCRHLFHEECLGRWLENYARICPLCRKDLEEAVEHREP